MKNHPFLMIALMLTLTLSACGAKAAPAVSFPPVPADYAGKTNPFGAEAAADGALNYVSYCASCHGATGRGDGSSAQAFDPRPSNLLVLATQVGDDYLFWRISEGKAGTSMVGWAGVLSEEQIWQVIAYLHSL